MRPDAVGDIRIKALLRPDRLRRKSHGAAPNFSLWRNYLPKAACKTHCRLKKSPLFSTLLPNGRKKKPRTPAGCQNYMVVGTGFEPVNGKAERIYSPRPLAPWIPYHRVNWDLNIHSAIFGTSFFFNFFRFSARLRTRQNADFRRARAAETLLKPLARHHKPPVARGDYQPPAPKFRSVRISGYFFNPHRLRVFLVAEVREDDALFYAVRKRHQSPAVPRGEGGNFRAPNRHGLPSASVGIFGLVGPEQNDLPRAVRPEDFIPENAAAVGDARPVFVAGVCGNGLSPDKSNHSNRLLA